MYIKEYKSCRLCNGDLFPILDLGHQKIQGAFYTKKGNTPPERAVPQLIMKCSHCHLVQNLMAIDPDILYSSYFYKSSISNTMRTHLKNIVDEAVKTIKTNNPTVIDIAANDFTLLKNYPSNYRRIAIDPSDISLAASTEEGNENIELINKCFPVDLEENADIITSIACFYDVNEPISFARSVCDNLSDHGIWICEFAYLPHVLKNLSYDGMVHEHVTLYSFATFERVLNESGLKAIKVVENDVNGGSLQVWATKRENTIYDNLDKNSIINTKVKEFDLKLDTDYTYKIFADRVAKHKEELVEFIKLSHARKKRIHVLGMSTKLNTILQYCGIDNTYIEAAAERDPDKIGGKTLNGIPMISEEESRKVADIYLVGPYHFRKELIEREKDFIEKGGKLLFPLPVIELISKE